jgi:hypothetical protein
MHEKGEPLSKLARRGYCAAAVGDEITVAQRSGAFRWLFTEALWQPPVMRRLGVGVATFITLLLVPYFTRFCARSEDCGVGQGGSAFR